MARRSKTWTRGAENWGNSPSRLSGGSRLQSFLSSFFGASHLLPVIFIFCELVLWIFFYLKSKRLFTFNGSNLHLIINFTMLIWNFPCNCIHMFCPISIFLYILNWNLYFVLIKTENDRRTVETCFHVIYFLRRAWFTGRNEDHAELKEKPKDANISIAKVEMHREISGLREEIGYNYGYENSNFASFQ